MCRVGTAHHQRYGGPCPPYWTFQSLCVGVEADETRQKRCKGIKGIKGITVSRPQVDPLGAQMSS